MTIKQEIIFWQKAQKLFEKNYGVNRKPHKGGIDLDCAECRASIAYSIIDRHIDLLKWQLTKKPRLNP